jgi:Protein of unknown function (DUF2844)
MRSAFRFVAVCAVCLCASASALAALGGDLSSIQSDQARLRASVRIMPARQYTVHEMQTPAGTTIRQFVSPSGTVFAVSWQGTAPDLQQLLGDYFNEYMQAASAQPGRRGRGIHIDTGDLVFESGGHMRFVTGRAFLRSKMPSGVRSDQIR